MRLNVNYNGQRIGQILSKNGISYFEFDIRFIHSALPLSPLNLPVRRGVTIHEKKFLAGLPGLIYDSLPDGFGLSVIRDHFKSKAQPNPAPLQVLSYLGNRTMGALTYSPPDGDEAQQRSIDLVSAARSARHLIELEHGTTLDPALIQAGGTAGGVQPKILASISKDGAIITGADAVPEGMTPWIIKLNTKNQKESAYAPLEYAYSQMAKDCGITVPKTNLLVDKNGIPHFAIKRFDRDQTNPNVRIHTHTYAGLAEVDYQSLSGSYEHLFETTYALTRSYKELNQLLLRCIFNVLAHNHDDHSKNFSFQMDASGQWKLAPAYDLTISTNNLGGNWLTLNNKRRDFSNSDLYSLVEAYRIPESRVRDAVETVLAVVQKWNDYAAKCGVSSALSREVGNYISSSCATNFSSLA